ncbi:hypothetical protein IWQ60_008427 [Tieghemiomyces parasiticus]|uniref:Uncharacterized protein n=1 Tax=Tieghemiomyces parasiticus TaxID=78921 RepID=A0A9W7ZXT8_9FUNG|nr:hypothetical protein IWQ60_008427 [Tieghemiomyces parasiticus]
MRLFPAAFGVSILFALVPSGATNTEPIPSHPFVYKVDGSNHRRPLSQFLNKHFRPEFTPGDLSSVSTNTPTTRFDDEAFVSSLKEYVACKDGVKSTSCFPGLGSLCIGKRPAKLTNPSRHGSDIDSDTKQTTLLRRLWHRFGSDRSSQSSDTTLVAEDSESDGHDQLRHHTQNLLGAGGATTAPWREDSDTTLTVGKASPFHVCRSLRAFLKRSRNANAKPAAYDDVDDGEDCHPTSTPAVQLADPSSSSSSDTHLHDNTLLPVDIPQCFTGLSPCPRSKKLTAGIASDVATGTRLWYPRHGDDDRARQRESVLSMDAPSISAVAGGST